MPNPYSTEFAYVTAVATFDRAEASQEAFPALGPTA